MLGRPYIAAIWDPTMMGDPQHRFVGNQWLLRSAILGGQKNDPKFAKTQNFRELPCSVVLPHLPACEVCVASRLATLAVHRPPAIACPQPPSPTAFRQSPVPNRLHSRFARLKICAHCRLARPSCAFRAFLRQVSAAVLSGNDCANLRSRDAAHPWVEGGSGHLG